MVYLLVLFLALAAVAVAMAALCFGFATGKKGPRQEMAAGQSDGSFGQHKKSWSPRGDGTEGWRRPPPSRTASDLGGRPEVLLARSPPGSGSSGPAPASARRPSASASPADSPRPSLLVGPSPRIEVKKPPMPAVRHLCPNLVVPDGMELVFAVREVVTKEKQEVSFSILDMEAKPLSHVVVKETGADCGIHLKLLDGTPLAWVRTKMLHERPFGLPEICYPSGQPFCTFGRVKPGLTLTADKRLAGDRPGYELRDAASGQRVCSLHGDFREKAINMFGAAGQPVCTTERCILPFDDRLHYQVRVAPNVDAGLVLCGLLALDKLEGAAPPAGGAGAGADLAGKPPPGKNSCSQALGGIVGRLPGAAVC